MEYVNAVRVYDMVGTAVQCRALLEVQRKRCRALEHWPPAARACMLELMNSLKESSCWRTRPFSSK